MYESLELHYQSYTQEQLSSELALIGELEQDNKKICQREDRVTIINLLLA